MRLARRFVRVVTLALLVGCASAYPANPRLFASAAGEIEALHIGSYSLECHMTVRDASQIRELLALLQEARPAVLETYGAEHWLGVEWRNGSSREFYVGLDWIAPVRTGYQDAISGWRLPSGSFQPALVLVIDQDCMQPLPPDEAP